MREIIVPQDIELRDNEGEPVKDQDGKPVVISQRVLVLRCLDHESFSKSRSADRAARAIEAGYPQSIKPGDRVRLADEDWRLLCEVLEGPRPAGYSGMVLRRVSPLIDSILGAKEPEKLDAAEEKPANGARAET